MTTTPDAVEHLALAADFPTPSYEEWAEAVAKVLNRGRPEDKQLTPEQSVGRLTVNLVDGLTIKPMYTLEDCPEDLGVPGVAPFTRGTTVRNGDIDSWDVRALHEDPDTSFTNKAILTDLERGVTSLWLRLDPDAIAPADLSAALDGVMLELAPVEVSSNTDQAAAAEALLDLAGQAKDPSAVTVTLGIDPIGHAARNGSKADLSGLATWVERSRNFKSATPFVVDGTVWHNAGAGDIHETGWILATAVEYVRALIEAGVSADDAFDAIRFKVSATTDQFATISRIRALRTCWSRIGEVFGVDPAKCGARQHAVTSWREITRDDPYVNLLRATISTFSAGVGGCEAITVLPFDTAWGLPSDFSRRIARNTQIVLAEESNIGRVNDPAGGSWYVESLTRQIADKAWEELQTVEAAGGMSAYLESGKVVEVLDGLNAERNKRLATRKQPITGVSEFPNPEEKPVNAKQRPQAPSLGGLTMVRDSEMFEELRDRVAGSADAKVFLACLGARRHFGAREGFASNAFRVAGLPTPESEGGTPDEIVAKWKEAGSPAVVCLCSSAKVYAEEALPVAKALKDADVGYIYLAGNIKELGDDAEKASEVIDGTIALGMNIIEMLNTTLDELGVEK